MFQYPLTKICLRGKHFSVTPCLCLILLMPEMHLKQHLDLHIQVLLQKNKQKKRIQKFKETGDSQYIYQNKLDKACF